jgi:two-component system NtrC family sensor kinase
MNRQAEKMLGVSDEYIEKYFGINYKEMFSNEVRGKMEETIERVKETKSTVDMGEYWVRTDYVLGITGYPILSDDIVGSVVIMANDITEKKAFERQLIQSSRLAGIGELAAGVAHEINNPIGFVTSNTNSLSKYFQRISQVLAKYRELYSNRDDISRKDMIAKIEEIEAFANELKIEKAIKGANQVITENIDGLNRVAKIVKDLKTFSHVTDEKMDPVNINQILDDVLNLVRNEIKYKSEVVKDYGDIRAVSCFSSQLAQVFTNIIVNAAQAIEKNGIITVKTYEQNGNAVINITDTGCGMTKETMENIFNPFFTTKEAGKGTGLGLSITHQIIEKHRGDIRVKSEPGKGTSFEIRLPMN